MWTDFRYFFFSFLLFMWSEHRPNWMLIQMLPSFLFRIDARYPFSRATYLVQIELWHIFYNVTVKLFIYGIKWVNGREKIDILYTFEKKYEKDKERERDNIYDSKYRLHCNLPRNCMYRLCCVYLFIERQNVQHKRIWTYLTFVLKVKEKRNIMPFISEASLNALCKRNFLL